MKTKALVAIQVMAALFSGSVARADGIYQVFSEGPKKLTLYKVPAQPNGAPGAGWIRILNKDGSKVMVNAITTNFDVSPPQYAFDIISTDTGLKSNVQSIANSTGAPVALQNVIAMDGNCVAGSTWAGPQNLGNVIMNGAARGFMGLFQNSTLNVFPVTTPANNLTPGNASAGQSATYDVVRDNSGNCLATGLIGQVQEGASYQSSLAAGASFRAEGVIKDLSRAPAGKRIIFVKILKNGDATGGLLADNVQQFPGVSDTERAIFKANGGVARIIPQIQGHGADKYSFARGIGVDGVGRTTVQLETWTERLIANQIGSTTIFYQVTAPLPTKATFVGGDLVSHEALEIGNFQYCRVGGSNALGEAFGTCGIYVTMDTSGQPHLYGNTQVLWDRNGGLHVTGDLLPSTMSEACRLNNGDANFETVGIADNGTIFGNCSHNGFYPMPAMIPGLSVVEN